MITNFFRPQRAAFFRPQRAARLLRGCGETVYEIERIEQGAAGEADAVVV